MLEILFWDPAYNKDWLSLIEVKQHKTWQGMVLTYLMVKIELQNDNILNKDILNWMHLTWQLTGLCQCSTRLSARLDLNYYCLKQIYEMFLTLLFLLGRKQKCFWPINDWDLGSHWSLVMKLLELVVKPTVIDICKTGKQLREIDLSKR